MQKNNSLIAVGSAVKAGKEGKIQGYAVRYTGPSGRDRDGHYFDKNTDHYDLTGKRAVIWFHGWNKAVKATPVGYATLDRRDKGVWVDANIDISLEAGKKIYAKAQRNELGWSSDSAGHLVEIEPTGRISRWPITAVSLAPAYEIKDPHALAVVGVKAFRSAVKAGGIKVSSLDYTRLQSLVESFETLIGRITRVMPSLTRREPSLTEIASEISNSGFTWKIDDWESQIETALCNGLSCVKAGKTISAANRELIQKCVRSIAIEIKELQALLDTTDGVASKANPPDTGDDLALQTVFFDV